MISCRFGPRRLSPSLVVWQVRHALLNINCPDAEEAKAILNDTDWKTVATVDWAAPFGRREIRIVLEGLRGEVSIAELCRKEGINQNLYYRWSKEFLEAGKKRLAGDTAREVDP